jgi:hypothetical protein
MMSRYSDPEQAPIVVCVRQRSQKCQPIHKNCAVSVPQQQQSTCGNTFTSTIVSYPTKLPSLSYQTQLTHFTGGRQNSHGRISSIKVFRTLFHLLIFQPSLHPLKHLYLCLSTQDTTTPLLLPYSTLLYSTPLYCPVLSCTVLCCTVPFSTLVSCLFKQRCSSLPFSWYSVPCSRSFPAVTSSGTRWLKALRKCLR